MNSKEIEQSLIAAEDYFRSNNYQYAERILTKIIEEDSSNTKANELLAYIYGNQGNFDLSLKLLKIAGDHPNCSPEALYYLGALLLKSKDFEGALLPLKRSLEIAGDFFEGLHDAGTACAQLDKKDEALNFYNRALEIKQNSHELFFNIARIYDELNEPEIAINYYDKAIKLNPNFSKAYLNRGILFDSLKNYDEAIKNYDEAIQLDQNYAEAWCNKGATLNNLRRYSDAITHFNNAIKINPDYVEALSNIGQSFAELKNYDLAMDYYNQALKINCKHRETINNKSLLNLHLKNFKEGWQDFDIRIQLTKFKYPIQPSIVPIWDGQETIQHMLIAPEQGLGDQIFYGAFLSDLKKFTREITVLIDPRLLEIFRRSFPDIKFEPKNSPINADLFDKQISIGSIPAVLNIDPRLNKQTKYQFLVPNSKEQLTHTKSSSSNSTLCGIAWKSANPKIGANKSIPLLKLDRLLINKNYNFINLQYGDVTEEINSVKKNLGVDIQQIEDIDLFEDIDGLLSIINACDIVVTTSNITAHLAGAIGKKTLLLVPYSQGRIWYWHDDEVSIWYPSIKQFFQDADFSWDNAINRVAAELELEIARKN